MATKAHLILTRVRADVADFQRGMKAAKRSLDRKMRKVRQAAKALAKYTAVITAAAAAITSRLIRSGLKSVDALAKQARAADTSIKSIQTLKLAADELGISESAVTESTLQLSRALGMAERGVGPVAEELRRLGVEASDLLSLNVDERFVTLAKAMDDASYSASQKQVALRNLGIRNQDMIRLLQDGAEAIDGAREAIERYGWAIDEVDAAKVEIANDAWGRVRRTLDSVANRIAIRVAPHFTALSELLLGVAEDAEEVGDAIDRGMRLAEEGVVLLSNSLKGVTMIILGIRLAAQTAISGLTSGWASFSGRVQRSHEELEGFLNRLLRIANIPIELNVAAKNVDHIKQLEGHADDAKGAVLELAEKIYDLWDTPVGDNVRKFMHEAKETAQEAAEEMVRNRREFRVRAGKVDEEANDKDLSRVQEAADREVEARLRAALSGLERVEALLRTEEDAIRHSYETRLTDIDEALRMQLISKEEHSAMMVNLEKRMADEIYQIQQQQVERERRLRQAAMQSTLGFMGSMLNSMGSMMDRENAKQFRMQQMLAQSSAAVSGIAAGMQGFAAAGGPTPAGFAAIAAAAATTAAQIAAIRRVSYSRGGGGVSAGGGVGGVSTPSGGRSFDSTLTVTGLDNPNALFTNSSMREFAERLSEFSNRGGRIIVA